MIKFEEQKQIDNVKGALMLRSQIEKAVDKIQKEGFDGIYFMGIGGTWASGMQVEVYMRGKSAIPVYVENAAEFITTGNKRFTDKSVVIFSSVTGNTVEMIDAVKKAKEIGAKVFGFIDVENSFLAKLCDICISYPMNEQLKFFMVANRLMYHNGEFPEYDEYNLEMEKFLPQALVEVEKEVDQWAADYAKEKYRYCKEHPDMPHYFIGAGNHWGATYSYAMCYWEEQLWIRTKSITSAEFFHGMLEIIEAETPVTLFIGEDEQRPLSERVASFLSKVCKNYTVIDTKDYKLEGIRPEFRSSISHLVMHAVNNRVDAHMEDEFKHPMVIRRYYRQFDY
ncbi:SIS domain-containing protein [Anaerosacchariphilus polymeriproducens]|uniref:SIS domain-containing protein n=1 Tax=Anaerosacchariphilus polymeriproducens TaxID=1812858 RepID=A0A371AWJ6_9FIRM|nr:SIS domain-containing protein [Anaerosacchariphilus polymeriproducens]RDU23840.1 SIS domain-containing protein [Anaerosacchariphilus polymeriproducens]